MFTAYVSVGSQANLRLPFTPTRQPFGFDELALAPVIVGQWQEPQLPCLTATLVRNWRLIATTSRKSSAIAFLSVSNRAGSDYAATLPASQSSDIAATPLCESPLCRVPNHRPMLVHKTGADAA